MPKYRYNGPVLVFGKIVAENWKAETIACSYSKAENNFKYQFKKLNNKLPSSANIELPGRIMEE